MSLLLDSHTLLWWIMDSPKLGRRARARISDRSQAVFVSAASAWELAIKESAGKLQLAEPLEVFLPRMMDHHAFTWISVTVEHAFGLRALPPKHGDPFDRILVAQAQVEGLTLVTADQHLLEYPVSTLDAAE